MKRVRKNTPTEDPDMLPHYDFSKGVRGKYAQRFAEGSNIIVLAPELTPYFPDSESVNAALRLLVKLSLQQVKTVGA